MVTAESQFVKDTLANLGIVFYMVRVAFEGMIGEGEQNPNSLARLRFASPIDDKEPHLRRTCEVRGSVGSNGIAMYTVDLKTLPPDVAPELLRMIQGQLPSQIWNLLEMTVEISETTLTFEVDMSPRGE